MQVKWSNNFLLCDLFMFLTSSLELLLKSFLKTDETQFKHQESLISSCYPNTKFKLRLHKGVFSYEKIDLFVKFDNYKLQLRKLLRNPRGKKCCAENSDYAQKRVDCIQVRDLEDYLKLFLTSDVCKLADVFQHFRSICHQNYHFDTAYFVSSAQLARNFMLKMRDLMLKLINDPEIYQIILPNIRVNICHASGRYAHANNIYIEALYRPNEPQLVFMYIDATNLYGWAMSQKLSFSDFEWILNAQLRKAEAAFRSDDRLQAVRFLDFKTRYIQKFTSIVNADNLFNSPAQMNFKPNTAYIFEVNLEYLANIHAFDNDYPLAPKLLLINTKMVSDKQFRLRRL